MEKPKISIMTFEDQIDLGLFAEFVLKEMGIKLTEDQTDELVSALIEYTDEFSVGDYSLVEFPS